MRRTLSTQWARDPAAWYQEPAWQSERLFAMERFEGRVVDPCAGSGTIIKSAKAAGLQAEAYDLRDRGFDGVRGGLDFFDRKSWPVGVWPAENIVSNPPYATWEQLGRGRPNPDSMARAEDEFLAQALDRVRSKVAVFMPSGWLNSEARGRWIETLPLYRVYLIGPRPSCPPGEFLRAGGQSGNGTSDYSWFVFLKGYEGAPTVHWMRRGG
jgi:hypothetical protein